MSPAALTVAAHVNRIVLPVDVLTLMDHSPATLRVLLGTIGKNWCLIHTNNVLLVTVRGSKQWNDMRYKIGYSPPLTNLAAQTEFSQPQKDCSGSSKDTHGL